MSHFRAQTRGEEIANWTSHSVGVAGAIAAFPILLFYTLPRGDTLDVLAVSLYASTMLLMFGSSMIYHMLPTGRAKAVLRKLDHAAIYLLIAGTYTPFTFSVLAGAWGWSLFGVIWALAALGLFLKFSNRLDNEWLSNGLYLVMGWLVLVAAVPLFRNLSLAGSIWLVAGGLAYTGGIVFYVLDSRLRFGHFIWHLFVLAGAACHFLAILFGCTPGMTQA